MGRYYFLFTVNAHQFFVTEIVSINPWRILFYSRANQSRHRLPDGNNFGALGLRKYPYNAEQFYIRAASKTYDISAGHRQG